MLVTRQKILRRFWYPVVPTDRLTLALPLLVSVPTPVMLPPVSVNTPLFWFVMSPVTATLPPSTLMLPSLTMLFVPDDSVAVPVGPLKLIVPWGVHSLTKYMPVVIRPSCMWPRYSPASISPSK